MTPRRAAPRLIAEIEFDRPLAQTPALESGFCDVEENFSWTIGPVSHFSLPCPGAGAYILILQGHPYLAPDLAAQRLIVHANGVEIARLVLDGLFTELIRIAPGLLKKGRARFTLQHPDCTAPARHGGTDTRLLGFRLWHMRLLRATPEKSAPQPRVLTPAGGMLAKLAATKKLPPHEKSLARRLAAPGAAIENAPQDLAFRELFINCLRNGWLEAATDLARIATPGADITLAWDTTTGTDPAVARITIQPARTCLIGLSAALRGLPPAAPGTPLEMIAWHLLATLPLLAAYTEGSGPAGTCFLNLGDEGHVRGLAFCNRRSMSTLLIPDPCFLARHGYAALRGGVAPWAARRAIAFWRGSTTGYRGTGGAAALPRARLAALAAQPENAAYLDAGFSALNPIHAPEEADALRPLLRGFVPAARQQEWKYLIDIDGNTNAWEGLFEKLLSGAVVLKVESAGGYRQWYYPHLKPFDNYVPVSADLSDLIEKIRILQANDAMARAIAAAGRALALSLGYESELARAQTTIEAAILIETHTSRLPPLP